MKKLVLLDAYALIYRAYYGFISSPRINSKGQNTSAIYGFLTTLQEVLQRENPDYVAVCFDPPGPTFRHEAYADYKAQREATPEDIRTAVPAIKDLLQAYRIAVVVEDGFEADDVIGTLARKGEEAGCDVLMVTPDKDYAQLVTDKIRMQKPGRGSTPWETLGPAEVCAKYGLRNPRQMVDYLALVGDKADNIAGCPGVGEKTAAMLMRDFADIEDLIGHTDRLKGALKKKVEDNAEQIRFSHFLTAIRTDVPLHTGLDELARREPDLPVLRPLLENLEFRSILQRLDGTSAKPAAPRHEPSLFDMMEAPAADQPAPAAMQSLADKVHSYRLITTDAECRDLCARLMAEPVVAIDTETTSTNAIDAQLVGMSFAAKPFEAYYVSVPADYEAARQRVELFRPLFEAPGVRKVGQNMKYDLSVLAHYGIEPAAPLFDTMLAHYVLQPELRHNLDYLAETYLSYRTIHIEDVIGPPGLLQKNMADLEPAEICDYACEDADVALQLYPLFLEQLRQTGALRVFDEIEMPLVPVLSRMERNGVLIDAEALKDVGRDFSERIAALEQEIYGLAGHAFLISSPRQVGDVLFGELHLSEKARKTKSGQYQTSEDVLRELATRHPIVQKILDYRALKKLLSTYIEALPKLINPHTGHIHTNFNQAVTATGRLSSSNPNLQNIPVRGEDGREIRRAFVPEPGEVFFSADYSQIELRLMAHLSKDAHMIEAFNEGFDIHAATAARIFHKDIGEVDRDERRKAKTANFGIIYGISAFGLAERMGVSRSEAKNLIESYFDTYPAIRAYIEECKEKARANGFIETIFGRRRYLPDINSRNATVRGYAERNAVNAPIQGSAADIIKLAMSRIDKRMQAEGFKAKLILQVHDELNFSVPPAELDRLSQLVKEEMERAYTLSVPLEANCGQGVNWLEAH
ncbi:MAG: DNA polymerase I [Alloprevotella sp.]|nr:DNA polymerase I [Alloprevotella sp.]